MKILLIKNNEHIIFDGHYNDEFSIIYCNDTDYDDVYDFIFTKSNDDKISIINYADFKEYCIIRQYTLPQDFEEWLEQNNTMDYPVKIISTLEITLMEK